MEAFTFDDLLLVPQYSEVKSRKDVVLESNLSPKIKLKLPIVSSCMDTVTEADMAIAMARHGGLGIVHRFCSIDQQVQMINKVKRAQNTVIENPYAVPSTQTAGFATQAMNQRNIGSLIVLDEDKICGIITKRDLRFAQNDELVKDLCTPAERMVFGGPKITLEEAKNTFKKFKVKNLPIINQETGKVLGLITAKDLVNKSMFPEMNLDAKGRILVGAAIGSNGDFMERAEALVNAETNILCIDVAHGHASYCGEAVRKVKEKFPEVEIMTGNVVTPEGVEFLKEAGADCVRVGVGSGSICSTRLVAGVGMPQLSAIMDCVDKNCHIIADGGIQKSGDIVKALAAGASSVMLGSALAGTDESPGRIIDQNGEKRKIVRGMSGRFANLSKMEKTGEDTEHVYSNFVPEGVEATVKYRGSVSDILNKFAGGIRSGCSYLGTDNLEGLRKNAKWIRISKSGVRESGIHDVKET